MRVEVRNNNLDGALRVLKKKLQQDGLFNEMRNREAHETNTRNVKEESMVLNVFNRNDFTSKNTKRFFKNNGF